MIRLTQTYLIKETIRLYERNDWETLYYDLPGGKRSGVGQRAQINSIWEKLYNLSPDILFRNSAQLRLFEVDVVLDQGYLDKFMKYKERESTLKTLISQVIGDVSLVTYGFVARRRQLPKSLHAALSPFYFYHYSNMQLHESILTSSER